MGKNIALALSPLGKENKPMPPPPSFSIKDAIKNGLPTISDSEQPSVVNEQPQAYEIKDSKPFTQEQLNNVWQQYADTYQVDDVRLNSTLTTQPPVCKENYVVELSLNNELQVALVEKIKFQLVNFLRKELSNGKIELVILIAETPQGSRRTFTAQDKFEVLAEKNPTLLKLRQTFGLDFG